jgi:hypothetical protein
MENTGFQEHGIIRRLRRPVAALLCLGAGFLAMSCGVQVDAAVMADRRATAQLNVAIHPVLQAYLADLAGTGKDGKAPDVINADRIRARLAEEPGITVRSLEASLKGGVRINLEIADLQKLFAGKNATVKNVFTMASEGGRTVLKVRLDRAAVESFIGMGLEKNDTSLRYLLPQNATMTADKYRENLRWALEEYGTAEQLAELFKTAVISVRLTLPGAVQSSSGFTVVDKAGGKLQLSLSLLELMTLQGSRLYEARY